MLLSVTRVFSLFVVSLVTLVMASRKILDLSFEGKNLRLRIAAFDLSVSRLSRAFQASGYMPGSRTQSQIDKMPGSKNFHQISPESLSQT